MSDTTMIKQIFLTRQSSDHWRVTFNHAPLNIFWPGHYSAAQRTFGKRKHPDATGNLYLETGSGDITRKGRSKIPRMSNCAQIRSVLFKMYTQAEYRIPPRAAQVRERKNPRFLRITGFGTRLSKEKRSNQTEIII
jgi:hypothetical protein